MMKRKKAYEILANPENWTKGTYARDAKGDLADAGLGLTAVSFCVMGAIYRKWGAFVSPDVLGDAMALEAHLRQKGIQGTDEHPGTVTYWNDTLATHADIIATLKELDI